VLALVMPIKYALGNELRTKLALGRSAALRDPYKLVNSFQAIAVGDAVVTFTGTPVVIAENEPLLPL
jgi:hypothetical protein